MPKSGAITGRLLHSKNQELLLAGYLKNECEGRDYLVGHDVIALIILYFVRYDFIFNEKKFKHRSALETKAMWMNSNFVLKCMIKNHSRRRDTFSVDITKISSFIKNITLNIFGFCDESQAQFNESKSITLQKSTILPLQVMRIELNGIKKSLNILWNVAISQIRYKNACFIHKKNQNEYVLKIKNMEKLEWLTTSPNAKHYLYEHDDINSYIQQILWTKNVFYLGLNRCAKGKQIKFMINISDKGIGFTYRKVFKFDVEDYGENIAIVFDDLDGIYYQIIAMQKFIKSINISEAITIKDIRNEKVITPVEDEWKFHDDTVTVSNTNEHGSMFQVNQFIDSKKTSVFGELLVKKGMKIKWDIKILQKNADIIIGVINITNQDSDKKYSKKKLAQMGIFGNVRTGNGYECNDIAWKHVKYRGFGQRFEGSQKISVILDLIEYKLLFEVNGKVNDTLTFNNLADGDYRLAATSFKIEKVRIVETNKIWVLPKEMKGWGLA